MNARLFDRLAALASMLILVGLGLSSYFLAQQAERMLRVPPSGPPKHEPDYFVERLKVLKVDDAGNPSLRIEARRMRHFPDDDTIEFDTPRIVTLAPDRPEIRVSAQRGVGPDDGSSVDLVGDVSIRRESRAAGAPAADTPDAARARALTATTDRATVLLEERVVVTDRPVDIEIGNDRLAGTGMRLESESRRLQLESAVRGTIAPRPAPAATGASGPTGAPGAPAAAPTRSALPAPADRRR
ncbi:MAG: LPS export ABC transporter periplasmic protein LptC [Lautropia sp.]